MPRSRRRRSHDRQFRPAVGVRRQLGLVGRGSHRDRVRIGGGEGHAGGPVVAGGAEDGRASPTPPQASRRRSRLLQVRGLRHLSRSRTARRPWWRSSGSRPRPVRRRPSDRRGTPSPAGSGSAVRCPSVPAGCRDHARAGRAVDVVDLGQVERELEDLGPGVEGAGIIVGDEEVTSAPVRVGRVRVAPDARP